MSPYWSHQLETMGRTMWLFHHVRKAKLCTVWDTTENLNPTIAAAVCKKRVHGNVLVVAVHPLAASNLNEGYMHTHVCTHKNIKNQSKTLIIRCFQTNQKSKGRLYCFSSIPETKTRGRLRYSHHHTIISNIKTGFRLDCVRKYKKRGRLSRAHENM